MVRLSMRRLLISRTASKLWIYVLLYTHALNIVNHMYVNEIKKVYTPTNLSEEHFLVLLSGRALNTVWR